MKIRDLTSEQLAAVEKKYKDKLYTLKISGRHDEDAYHTWFMLRLAGEERGLWLFVPAPERKEAAL